MFIIRLDKSIGKIKVFSQLMTAPLHKVLEILTADCKNLFVSWETFYHEIQELYKMRVKDSRGLLFKCYITGAVKKWDLRCVLIVFFKW